ncbi:hypothetical protein CG709_13455, partial [Lachnotalea glycerini]
MKKSFISMFLVVSMIMVMLAGCGQKESSSESTKESTTDSASDSTEETKSESSDYTIGFVPMTLNNEYFIAMCNGAQEKADELGVKLEIQAADSHASAADQLT